YQAGAVAPLSCSDGTQIGEGSINGTAHVVSGLNASTQYTFLICAINANATPAPSPGVAATATTSSMPPPPQASGLSATAISADRIDLEWTSGGGSTAGFRIAYQTGATPPASCGAGTQIGEDTVTGTAHSIV